MQQLLCLYSWQCCVVQHTQDALLHLFCKNEYVNMPQYLLCVLCDMTWIWDLHTSVKIETDLHNVLLFQFKDILKLEEDIPHVREAAKVK